MHKTVLAIAITSAFFCNTVQANGSDTPEPKLTPVETLQALKNAMGNVSRDDMEGYKSLFVLAQSPEAKKDVVRLMLVAETSTDDVFSALLNNEQATTWLLTNGYAEPNHFGKLVPSDQWDAEMNPKRSQLWGEHVGDTQKALNAELERLAEEDPAAYAKAVDVLGNIGVQKDKSILEYIGHDLLNDEVVDEFDGDLEKELIGKEKQKLEEKWAEKIPANGKELMEEVDSILGEDALENYAKSEDKQQASQSILESASAEQKQLLNLIYVPNPNAGSSSQPDTISLLEYLEGVAGVDGAVPIEPQPPQTGGSELALREAGKRLDKYLRESRDELLQGTAALREAALVADQTLSKHLQTKEEVARIELTKSKVKLMKAAENTHMQLSEQRQQDADALMAALQTMQAQLDAQAKQIAELQAGGIPGNNPPSAIDQELRDGLQTAGATMQQKMEVAQEKLETAAVGLGYVAEAVKQNKNGDVGINPPSDGGKYPSDHEFGSIGDGAAQEWLASRIEDGNAAFDEYVQSGIENGKVRMNDYMDTRLSDFEQELQSMYMEDMENFYQDVDARMDDVMASQHAITNARPFLINGGTAVGVGVGFAGDSSAVAVGVAHSFKDTGWSVSGSINATSGSNNDVSAGAGVQYSF